ncbi:MAG: hypothetical protein IJA30_02985 [Bacilli bacterium]|nr:hypothetical protein [Bacilli bacterium]
MSYEKKSLDSLDKVMDAVFYEEGRLAIINKYGASLDDADKVKATELITKQRANLDRLFGIYKEQLYPVMTEIDSVSQEMSSLVDKLLAAQNISLQQGTEATKVDSPVSEPAVETTAEITAVVDTPVEGTVATDGAQVVEETPVPVAVDNASVDVPVDSASVTDENAVGGEAPANDGAPVDSGTAATEETTESTEFVLSPIDEDVAPAKEDEKIAEEGAQVVDQQLQSIDAVKEEIANNPDLTADEKKVELEKYTRVSENAVKAILVTKAQYEKLLASKASQKALMNPEVKEETTSEVGGIPAIVGGDAPAEVQADAPAVVLPTIDNAGGADAPAASATPDADTNGVLPVINEAPASGEPVSNETPVQTESAGEGVVLPTIVPGDVPADVPGLATTEAVDKQKELQTMIDQANNLYKEGKTQEAQELFDKVGAINKEMQDSVPTETAAPALEIPTAESADAAVLVKK